MIAWWSEQVGNFHLTLINSTKSSILDVDKLISLIVFGCRSPFSSFSLFSFFFVRRQTGTQQLGHEPGAGHHQLPRSHPLDRLARLIDHRHRHLHRLQVSLPSQLDT